MRMRTHKHSARERPIVQSTHAHTAATTTPTSPRPYRRRAFRQQGTLRQRQQRADSSYATIAL
eukprot:scaffold8767_cov121-Isochrysis_galbana.AAC.4